MSARQEYLDPKPYTVLSADEKLALQAEAKELRALIANASTPAAERSQAETDLREAERLWRTSEQAEAAIEPTPLDKARVEFRSASAAIVLPGFLALPFAEQEKRRARLKAARAALYQLEGTTTNAAANADEQFLDCDPAPGRHE
jgi:hypothetical protein